MKRIATIGAVITAFAIAPSVASAGNVVQTNPQVKALVVRAQVVTAQRAQAAVTVQRHRVLLAQAQRAQAAVTVQRHRVQLAQAQRWATLRAFVR